MRGGAGVGKKHGRPVADTARRARSGAALSHVEVSHRRLGSSLRMFAEDCIRLGENWGWEPSAGSPAAEQWRGARTDPIAQTAAEADTYGVLLLRSGIEHAVVVAQTISAGRAFVPTTVARTAAEHCLRAHYAVEPGIDDVARSGRRVNDWLHAAREAERLHAGVLRAGLVPEKDAPNVGAAQMERVEDRATSLGLTITVSGDLRYVNEVGRRPSVMALAEQYLAGAECSGITTAVYRSANAVMHGLETGLLSASEPVETSFEVMRMKPRPLEAGTLAFELMIVPLAAANAMQALHARFSRAEDAGWKSLVKSRDVMLGAWSEAIDIPETADEQ